MIMVHLKCFSCSLIIINLLQTCYGMKINPPSCPPSACGNIRNISYPFRLRDDPKKCGFYKLACENNTTTLYFNSHKYIVQAINYHNNTIRLTYPDIRVNDTCSFPEYSLSPYNFTKGSYLYKTKSYRTGWNWWKDSPDITMSITLLSCPTHVVNNNSLLLETTSLCFNKSNRRRRTYIMFGHLNPSDIMDKCKIELKVMTSLPIKDEKRVSLSEIHSSLLYGFELSWMSLPFISWWISLVNKWTMYFLLFVTVFLVGINIAIRILIGVPFMLGLLIFKYQGRRHLSMFETIEGFLRSNNNLMPIRYSYSSIKKMTKGFREKLGEGGYGSVYKGKLSSGRDAAIKVLSNKQRANGQDFINEVGTIGRIHHVNVVKLIGYCVEGSKCALVYDFMPNGSLEKYILGNERTPKSLSWEKKYSIALGVARGIEYLHRGCDIQILHFDIKPHNILLDHDFTPKISDFGLAKFYSTDIATVTLTAARGTIGYVAPELINRSIGEVSYKADVYSFGMMLMEMVGLTKEVVADDEEKSSQYFPYWIYDRFNKGKDIEIGNFDKNDADNERSRGITKKMTIIGLWCIQMNPSDRPSMNEVVRMIERENEDLQIPPRPSELPQTNIHNNSQTWETESSDSIALVVYDASNSE